jgi:hypothetical protein
MLEGGIRPKAVEKPPSAAGSRAAGDGMGLDAPRPPTLSLRAYLLHFH